SGHRPVDVLDGDEVRRHLSPDLGFSRRDRDENVRRIAYVAGLLARNGVVAVVAAISPYAEAREAARQLAASQALPFVEVHVSAELEVLIRRDVKGLYRKALAGQLPGFTGVSDPYEVPLRPDLVVRTDHELAPQSAGRILEHLRQRGLML